MGIIYNGQYVSEDTNILLEKWKYADVFGQNECEKPGYLVFKNTAYALDLLKHHVDNNSKICLHTDVDVDGIGTTYIMKRALENMGNNKFVVLINKDKVHGIQKKHADYFNNNPIDLMLVTDSSCNEIEVIKQFTCDVLVIDHHDLSHNDLVGYCNDGVHRYVIVNNTIDNDNYEEDIKWLKSKNSTAFNNLEKYIGDSDMSCGLVVYEMLRLYCECFNNPKLLENLMLFQWVGVTLLTDVVNTINRRNQWYLDKTVFGMNMESSLKSMMHNLTSFKASLDKSYIQYTFAPTINKAIRAGQSQHALETVINKPYDIASLKGYGELQKQAVDKAITVETIDYSTETRTVLQRMFNTPTIMLDISKLGISPNYSGVIASRLSGDNNKNAAVFTITDKGLCKGSFRGKHKNVNYRKYFADYSNDIYAQGHPGAFGFELTKEQLECIMNTIHTIEPVGMERPWLTLGNMNTDEYGVYHIDSLDDFKRQGYIWKIAVGNSKVTSKDEIVIRVKASDVVLKSTKGKIFIYDVLGLECKAFKPLSGEYFDIYIEYTNEINMYIR